MNTIDHRLVAEAASTLYEQASLAEGYTDYHDLQFTLIQYAGNGDFERKDLIKGAIKDAWFLGYWALYRGVRLTPEAARNLVTPASFLHDVYWRRTKKELSTATGLINPNFMDLSPTMISFDPATGFAVYNHHADRIIERHANIQSKDRRLANKDQIGCPHGIIGMSRFLLEYLEFMESHITQPTPELAASEALRV